MSENEVDDYLKVLYDPVKRKNRVPLSSQDRADFHRITAIREIKEAFDTNNKSKIKGFGEVLSIYCDGLKDENPEMNEAMEAIRSYYLHRESELPP